MKPGNEQVCPRCKGRGKFELTEYGHEKCFVCKGTGVDVPQYKFYRRGIVLRPGDVLEIPFGAIPSKFRVIHADKRKNRLTVQCVIDWYDGPEHRYKPDEMAEFGREIYEQYWCFRKVF